jgi:hypothetical protein
MNCDTTDFGQMKLSRIQTQNYILNGQRLDFFELTEIYLQLRRSILSLKTPDLPFLIHPRIFFVGIV